MKLIEDYEVQNGIITKDKTEIKLSKIEKKIVELLEKNNNTPTTLEEIEKVAWYGKKCTVYSIRNAIVSIRKKTSEALIRSEFNVGYIFNKKEDI